MEPISVASSGNVMMTNAAVSPKGRLFGNFPRWTGVDTPSVGEATPDGGFKPFPGGAWNEWRPGLPPHDRFVCTHGLYADRDNNLWVMSHMRVDVVRIPPITGITSDAAGTLYFSAMTEDGVLKMGPDRKLQTLIRDERISGPNEGSIGPNGFYYFPNSQAPRVHRPYEVFKIKLP